MIKLKDLLEKSGAGDWGTDELRKTLEKGTPGQGITDIGLKNKDRKESVEFAESDYKVIKVVGDDYKKMKKGRSYGTFPATDKGRDQATSFQLKLKRQKGIEADLVWESLDELDSKTYRSYIDKAQQDQINRMQKKKQTDKDKQTMRRRSLGIATAQSKQYGDKRSISQRIRGEEVELDETTLSATKKPVTVTGPDGKTRTVMRRSRPTRTDDHGNDIIRTNRESTELDEISRMTKMKAAIARGIRGPSKKATPTWARETGKAAKELKKRAAQTAEYEKKKKAMQQRSAITSFNTRKEEVDLDEAKVAWVVTPNKGASNPEKWVNTEIRNNGSEKDAIINGAKKMGMKPSDVTAAIKYPGDKKHVKEDIDLQERPFGGDGVLKDVMPGIMRFLDRTVNAKRYKFAVRTFLDLRKKNPNKARENLVKTAKIVDVDVRTLDRLFRDMVKKGVMPKHLINYHPTFVEGKSFKEIAEKACWKGYKQVGMKKKNGKEVPNCVPEEKE